VSTSGSCTAAGRGRGEGRVAYVHTQGSGSGWARYTQPYNAPQKGTCGSVICQCRCLEGKHFASLRIGANRESFQEFTRLNGEEASVSSSRAVRQDLQRCKNRIRQPRSCGSTAGVSGAFDEGGDGGGCGTAAAGGGGGFLTAAAGGAATAADASETGRGGDTTGADAIFSAGAAAATEVADSLARTAAAAAAAKAAARVRPGNERKTGGRDAACGTTSTAGGDGTDTEVAACSATPAAGGDGAGTEACVATAARSS